MTDTQRRIDAPRSLHDLRDWLVLEIDGGDECRARDQEITGYIAALDAWHRSEKGTSPASRSAAALPANVRRTLEESNLPHGTPDAGGASK